MRVEILLLLVLLLLHLCFMQKVSDDFEVAIVGAGPAGSTCAYFLSK